MSHATEKAQALLDGVKDALPLRVNEMTTPDQEIVIATIRKDDGYPFLQPHPEALSMLTAPRPYFEFVFKAGETIKELLAEIEGYEANSKPSKANPA
jgi:hypothetical protein